MQDGLGEDSFEREDSVEDIRVTAPKEPEVNPDVYTDTISLITHGFLTTSAEIGGVPFVFKSLNHHEFRMVQMLSGFDPNGSTVPPRFWDLFITYMVLFVDGQNILVDRQKWFRPIADMFHDIPVVARQKIVRQISELNRKASNATLLVECYATETYSRWYWAQTMGLDLCSPTITGIEGTDKLGLCYAQMTWRAINHYEDIRHRQDVEWENSKFIGGCFAGKGMQSIHNRDRERNQKERETKFARKERLLRHVLLGEPIDTAKRYNGAQVVIVANTVEELADQVQRSLRGEKDWHDEVVEQHEAGLRQKRQERQEHITQMAEMHRQEMGGRDIVGQSDISGLTPQEVAERLRHQREGKFRSEAEAQIDERAKKAMGNFGAPSNFPSTGRPVEGAIPLQNRRSSGKPWRP